MLNRAGLDVVSLTECAICVKDQPAICRGLYAALLKMTPTFEPSNLYRGGTQSLSRQLIAI